MSKTKAKEIYKLLNIHYPSAHIILNYSNNWELLVSVILSAQSTDKQVNKVTKKLFKKYKALQDYVDADPKEFEKDIHSAGFFRNKTKNILSSAKIVHKRYKGKVPDTMKKLITLPGVARKTANVVLGNAYKKSEGIAVDTHVKRLSQRIGLSKSKNPEKIEEDLMKLFARKNWYKFTYLLIEHGRSICDERSPKCKKCFLDKICPSAYKICFVGI